MARDWSDLFIVDRPRATAGAPSEPPAEPADAPPPEVRGHVLARLRDSLRKTRQTLGAELHATFSAGIGDDTWERLEEVLIGADLGARTTAEVVERLEYDALVGRLAGEDELRERLTELLAGIAADAGDGRIDLRAKPTVILVAGVNGTGKTTTTGKLAHHLVRELGYEVVLAAADTFRAAAVEQLEQWAHRTGAHFVRGPDGSDPGAVAFEGVATGVREHADVVIVDTAGRLHTQNDLMAELAKIHRVIAKQLPDAPHETLLTVDATTGQNGLRQAELFAASIEVSGLVLTKLDGTAKGGIALAIAAELGIPVKLIGIGEQLEDLRPFDAPEFARALVS